jgi:hypothetical protein
MALVRLFADLNEITVGNNVRFNIFLLCYFFFLSLSQIEWKMQIVERPEE